MKGKRRMRYARVKEGGEREEMKKHGILTVEEGSVQLISS